MEAARLWHDLGLLAVVLPEVVPPAAGAHTRIAGTYRCLPRSPRGWFPEAADLLHQRLAATSTGDEPAGRSAVGRLMHALRAGEVEEAAGRLRLSGRWCRC